MLLCTQLAPARHVIQVGENNSNRRGRPASRLNSDFNVEIRVSEMTRPLGAALARLWLEDVQEASATVADSATASARDERSPSCLHLRMTRMTVVPSASPRMPLRRIARRAN
jgi:hypothetical protein